MISDAANDELGTCEIGLPFKYEVSSEGLAAPPQQGMVSSPKKAKSTKGTRQANNDTLVTIGILLVCYLVLFWALGGFEPRPKLTPL